MIEVQNLSFAYNKNGRKILNNVNLKVKEKQITALIGANGAGKSTLLGAMTNINPITEGIVKLGGKDIRKMKTIELSKQIAFLHQATQLNVRITIQDLVEYGRFPHCKGRLGEEDHAKVAEALDYMNLTEIKDSYLDALSGGQRQRAFIAMILAQDTPYIFLDEPLNNLDIKYSVEMMKIVRQLVDELGKTVVVVLHDINFACAYADHIVAMKNGEIFHEGDSFSTVSEPILDHVFDHEFHIHEVDGKKVCLCFDEPEWAAAVQKQKALA